MAERAATLEAIRLELFAPVASFRDPMFPGVTRCLPVPPPSTLRGMLAAATGRESEPIEFGVCARAEGAGTDAETYHPVAADGSNPPIGGRVHPGKGGMTIRDRPFLAGVHVTLWIPLPEGARIEAALRRPVWGLRLGRSQDLVHLRSSTKVTLTATDSAQVGHALAPPGGHRAPQASLLRLADQVSLDRLRTEFSDYLWCAEPPGDDQPVVGAYCDGDQAVWLHRPVPVGEREQDLAQVFGKSAAKSKLGRPELLTEHSETVRDAALTVAERIGSPGILADHPRFWFQVITAALLHDTGKIAEGFQRQLRPGGDSWGERHEVLSLAYVDLLTRHLAEGDRKMIAAGVAFHHRCLISSTRRDLREMYPIEAAWEKKFGIDRSPPPGRARVQVPPARHAALLRWLTTQARLSTIPDDDRRLWELARETFSRVHQDWHRPVPPDEGLVAVLLQGAVTLADRSGSAHVPLQEHMPLPQRFIETMPDPYPHQVATADTKGHLVLCAPTGSGKTEAGLAWASRQLEDHQGRPRLIWVLPYRASIDAARDRFVRDLIPPLGQDEADIGILHATAARTLLTRATTDDCPPGPQQARKARDQVNAMRLFAQRVRVATPHQLLHAAIAGPSHSSLLLEQANALIALDELHAYDPATFGRLCAAMRLWEKLGSKVAVLSATLAPPMIELLQDTLPEVTVHRAPPGTAPDRHRLVLDQSPITTPSSVERARRWLVEGHSVLLVANTVATAQRLYNDLAPCARTLCPGDPDAAILLHSRFRAKDRARIERRILDRHPERRPGEVRQRGGLVVATQVLEVSLCLDFDRGASELAPIEAVAQRAGRVNRRGRHPDGPVEFRIHQTDTHLPYEEDALQAAWAALEEAPGPIISEQTIATWLQCAYDSPWGREWAKQAKRHRDDFFDFFLTFTDPFHDRSEHANGLDEAFDTAEALLTSDIEEFSELSRGPQGDPLLAAGLLIPVPHRQIFRLARNGRAQKEDQERARRERRPPLWLIDAPYNDEIGLDLTHERTPVIEPDTVL
ncbi:CRISPR-associated helicase Cas3' [Spirillospora sp. CA-294931]|uniref:CRISPR-associated helicase Cas3' n=1 Tax=Spirillospora sp. CA-294931 TaxID=3240042 RepID=UPI003D94FB05